MNNRLLAGLFVLVFAVALAVVLGLQLAGQAAAITFGAAIGVIVGVPTGLGSAYLAHRWGWFPQAAAPTITTVQQIEGHLISRNYEGFAGPRGPKIRGRLKVA